MKKNTSRFQREKNITSVTHKQEENKPTKKSVADYFFHSYKNLKQHHLIRNTVLFGLVLFITLFAISFALPRIFSFNISSITSLFMAENGDISEDENEGDIDILLLGRGGTENDAPDLTDTIILAHYDKSGNTVSMTSIPRDLIVQSDVLGKVRINEIYSSTKRSLGEEAGMKHLLSIVKK